MSKLKFRTQLIIGFVILIFINFLITNSAIVQIRSISSDTELIYEHPLIVSNAVRDINININAIHRTMKDLVLSENTEQFNNSLQLVNYYDSLNYVSFKTVKERFLGNKSIVDDAYKTVEDWEIIRNEVLREIKCKYEKV